MPRGKAMRAPNGYGTIVKLSGNRRKPFEVRVNTHINEYGYPVYDVLGRYETRTDADVARAKYHESPYDISANNSTFEQVYNAWFTQKYIESKRKYSTSSINCTKGAYKKCISLHNRLFKDLRKNDLQTILDDYTLSHAYMEHIKNLFNQMYKFALENDIVQKDHSQFTRITKPEDDTPGVPFTKEEIRLLWENVDKVPFVDTVLIYIYSGWRCMELLTMPIADIDIENWTFKGGMKTESSKNRIVPIHTLIRPYVANRLSEGHNCLIANNDRPVIYSSSYMPLFKKALLQCGITTPHTPHDCRHTFTSLLNSAGANDVCIDRLLGHASKSITKRTYTHKDIEELREAVELIEKEP